MKLEEKAFEVGFYTILTYNISIELFYLYLT